MAEYICNSIQHSGFINFPLEIYTLNPLNLWFRYFMLIKTVATLLEFSLLLTTREKGIQFSCLKLKSRVGKEQRLWSKTQSRLD